jgi:hypothetical protein
MNVLGNLIKYIFRAFFRIVFSALFFGLIGAGIVLLVAALATGHWPPDTLTISACVAIGVLAAYAAGITVLVGEAVSAVRDVEQDVAKEIKEVESKR